MKKWKLIKKITISFLYVFVVYVIYLTVVIYNSNAVYPFEALGAIRINNWLENFGLELLLRLTILGIPLIVDIVLLIISIGKCKSKNYNS